MQSSTAPQVQPSSMTRARSRFSTANFGSGLKVGFFPKASLRRARSISIRYAGTRMSVLSAIS